MTKLIPLNSASNLHNDSLHFTMSMENEILKMERNWSKLKIQSKNLF